jgi:prolyl 4-hydroxylase
MKPELFRAVLGSEDCKAIIDSLETSQPILNETGNSRFTTYPIPPSLRKSVISQLHTLRYLYLDNIGMSYVFPDAPIIELANIKVYEPGDSMYWHVDAVTKDTIGRVLGFLFYLNDEYTGGETQYHEHGYFRGDAGDCLVFSPTWENPHCGTEVKTGKKIILTCYLRVN